MLIGNKTVILLGWFWKMCSLVHCSKKAATYIGTDWVFLHSQLNFIIFKFQKIIIKPLSPARGYHLVDYMHRIAIMRKFLENNWVIHENFVWLVMEQFTFPKKLCNSKMLSCSNFKTHCIWNFDSVGEGRV